MYWAVRSAAASAVKYAAGLNCESELFSAVPLLNSNWSIKAAYPSAAVPAASASKAAAIAALLPGAAAEANVAVRVRLNPKSVAVTSGVRLRNAESEINWTPWLLRLPAHEHVEGVAVLEDAAVGAAQADVDDAGLGQGGRAADVQVVAQQDRGGGFSHFGHVPVARALRVA